MAESMVQAREQAAVPNDRAQHQAHKVHKTVCLGREARNTSGSKEPYEECTVDSQQEPSEAKLQSQAQQASRTK
jgi:hypothetical protein